MINYCGILRLKSLRYLNTDIAASVHSSRNTVQEVLEHRWPTGHRPLADDVTNGLCSLESLLYPESHKKDADRMPLITDFPKIHRELARKGVTLSLLWTECRMEAKDADKAPYMSTQFNENYRKWARCDQGNDEDPA